MNRFDDQTTMARQARKQSGTGIYHVMLRGINRQDIFVMSNHLHLLIQERTEGISETIKRLGVSYAHYYNKKYERTFVARSV